MSRDGKGLPRLGPIDPAAYQRKLDALNDVSRERNRQERLFLDGVHARRMSDPEGMTHAERLAVLVEEVGEVSREICESIGGRPIDKAHLREELVQNAAVCVAWIEALDAEDDTP